MDTALVVDNITKKYKLYKNPKERLMDFIIPGKYGEDFYALRNVTFEAKTGEVIGFVGINGSGKSTLSNVIAGIVPETSGSIKVNGQVSLIAISAGLNQDLTGRDNIELKLLMLGFNRKEIMELEQEIIEFSELGDFIDQPVKSYSSGMRSRLGFSISVNIDPDILIVDEALSVGDRAFSEKSLEKMKQFKDDGKTMIFVSHSLRQMRQFCDKILWLEFGKIKEFGKTEKVLPKYEQFLKRWKELTKSEREKYRINILNKKETSLEYLIKKPKLNTEKKLVEKSISRVGRFWPSETYLYSSPTGENKKKLPSKLRNQVYFIKKSASYNGVTYYLISTKPSAIDGIVGWVKKSSIATFRQTFIDKDEKKFLITGQGKAYNKPWGGDKNVVISDLSKYKNSLFVVKRTDRIGKNLWFNGILNDNEVWIPRKFLKNIK